MARKVSNRHHRLRLHRPLAVRVLRGLGVEVARIFDQSPENMARPPAGIGTTDAEAFIAGIAGLDLVVELAHPDVSAQLGERIISKTNYMPCSVVALADERLRTGSSPRHAARERSSSCPTARL